MAGQERLQQSWTPMHHANAAGASQPLPLAAGAAPRLSSRRCTRDDGAGARRRCSKRHGTVLRNAREHRAVEQGDEADEARGGTGQNGRRCRHVRSAASRRYAPLRSLSPVFGGLWRDAPQRRPATEPAADHGARWASIAKAWARFGAWASTRLARHDEPCSVGPVHRVLDPGVGMA